MCDTSNSEHMGRYKNCESFRSYSDFINDLKPIWLGGIECTDRIDNDGKSSGRVAVEVWAILCCIYIYI